MIEREVSDGIHILRIAHGKANALDVDLLKALRHELQGSAQARAVIITGRGSIFSAGVDLIRLTTDGADYVRAFYPQLAGFVRELFALPVPVVAAVNGHAIAGGAVMTFAADYRLMAKGTGRFGVPELLVSVPFPPIVIEVLRFAVAPERLQSLVYLGDNVPADEALQRGYVDELIEPAELMARALQVAQHLAGIPAHMFRATKQALRAPALARIDRDSTADLETQRIWTDPATHEGIRDYLQRVVRK